MRQTEGREKERERERQTGMKADVDNVPRGLGLPNAHDPDSPPTIMTAKEETAAKPDGSSTSPEI